MQLFLGEQFIHLPHISVRCLHWLRLHEDKATHCQEIISAHNSIKIKPKMLNYSKWELTQSHFTAAQTEKKEQYLMWKELLYPPNKTGVFHMMRLWSCTSESFSSRLGGQLPCSAALQQSVWLLTDVRKNLLLTLTTLVPPFSAPCYSIPFSVL